MTVRQTAKEPVRGPARKRAASRRKRKADEGAEAPVPSGRRRAATWFRRLGILGLVIGMAPFVLIIVYAAPGIRPVSTLMVGEAIGGGGYVREWTPLDEFPPAVVASVLASEDGRFCSHSGVDWPAMADVARDAWAGERTRGASTVTMQTVKNLFLPANRSMLRKAIEVPLATFADFVWGKRRTLEIYLNIAEWAPGHFGAAAGSKAWFGRDVRTLSRREAARLAVTLPNPHIRNPADPGPRVAALARVNERRAREMGPYLDCLIPPPPARDVTPMPKRR